MGSGYRSNVCCSFDCSCCICFLSTYFFAGGVLMIRSFLCAALMALSGACSAFNPHLVGVNTYEVEFQNVTYVKSLTDGAFGIPFPKAFDRTILTALVGVSYSNTVQVSIYAKDSQVIAQCFQQAQSAMIGKMRFAVFFSPAMIVDQSGQSSITLSDIIGCELTR
jgi:hypothetical protein